MHKKFLIIATASASMFLAACNETPKQENQTTITDSARKVQNPPKVNNFNDKDGNTLNVTIDDEKGIATILYNGDKIDLKQENAASGTWYKNDSIELIGNGNDIQLKKNGKILFEHKDDTVASTLKDKDGNTLVMTYNNTENIVQLSLNGGEAIILTGQKPASGILYKNALYELKGKGEQLELTKEGKTVFKN